MVKSSGLGRAIAILACVAMVVLPLFKPSSPSKNSREEASLGGGGDGKTKDGGESTVPTQMKSLTALPETQSSNSLMVTEPVASYPPPHSAKPKLPLKSQSDEEVAVADSLSALKAELQDSMISPKVKKSHWFYSETGGNDLLEVNRTGKCTDNSNCNFAKNNCVADELGVCYNAPRDISVRDFIMKNRDQVLQEGGDPAGYASGGPMSGGSELVCSYMPPSSDPLPELDLKDRSKESKVKVFKHLTGSFFENWYDWEASIKEVKVDESFTFSGGHQDFRHASVYKLNNFCLNLEGRLLRYEPRQEEKKPTSEGEGGGDSLPAAGTGKPNSGAMFPKYIGGDEQAPMKAWVDVGLRNALSATRDARFVHDWLPRGQVLDEKPSWYVDRKLALMPLLGYNQTAHTMLKMGAFLYNIEYGFPRDEEEIGVVDTDDQKKMKIPKPSFGDGARDDVTTAFITFPRLGKAASCDLTPSDPNWRGSPDYCGFHRWNAFKGFTSLATTTHLNIFGPGTQALQQWSTETEAGRKFLQSGGNLQELDAFIQEEPICFKEAIVYQSCSGYDCEVKREPSNPAWPGWGYRNSYTQQLIAQRFRHCAGVPKNLLRTKRDRVNAPTVIYTIRSGFRKFHDQPSYIPLVHELFLQHTKGKGRFVACEFGSLSLGTSANLYSQADLLFGCYGGGFMPGFLMPPGSLGVQIRILHYPWDRAAIKQGIDVNRKQDYGGMWFAGRSHEVQVLPPVTSLHVPREIYSLDLAWRKQLFNTSLVLQAKTAQWMEEAEQKGRRQPCLGIDWSKGRGAFLSKINMSCPEGIPHFLIESEEFRRRGDSLNREFGRQLRPPEDYDDAEGTTLKQNIMFSVTPRIAPYANRLYQFYQNASHLSQVFNKLRVEKLLNKLKVHSPKVLIVLSCQAKEGSDDDLDFHLLMAELYMWRRYVSPTVVFDIVYDRPCPQAQVSKAIWSTISKAEYHEVPGRGWENWCGYLRGFGTNLIGPPSDRTEHQSLYSVAPRTGKKFGRLPSNPIDTDKQYSTPSQLGNIHCNKAAQIAIIDRAAMRYLESQTAMAGDQRTSVFASQGTPTTILEEISGKRKRSDDMIQCGNWTMIGDIIFVDSDAP